MEKVQISLPLTIKIIYEKEAKDAPYVAYSPELDVSSCGSTEDEAQKNLYEALELVLAGAAEDGTLEELLQEAGFTLQAKKVKPPKVFFSPFSFTLPASAKSQRLYAALCLRSLLLTTAS